MDPSSSLLGSSVNDFECFGRQTKIENWLQFSIFNFKTSAENRKTKPCHRLQHCRKSNMDLIFLFIVDRIKVKYKLCFNILSKGNKVQNFRCVCHSSIQFLFKIKNWKLMSIFYFFKFVIRKNTKVPNRKYLTFFLLVEYWNITHIFTLILSKWGEKSNWAAIVLLRQCCSLWRGLVFLFSAEV